MSLCEFNKFRRRAILGILVWGIVFSSSILVAKMVELPPIENSKAYQRYALRKNKSELSKLLYLIDRFRNTQYMIHYEGQDYDGNTALSEARKYIQSNYNKEPAMEFIQVHAYRPKFGNGILYLKDTQGEKLILRDVLLEEMRVLEKLEK